MRCLVIGATGYVGTRLVPRLLAAGHTVRCLVRSPERLARTGFAGQVEQVVGSVADPGVTRAACRDVDAVVHLVHSMDGPGFAERDRAAAGSVAGAAAATGVRRIVYLGGLRPAGGGGSAHLRSRAEVGRILLAGPVPAAVLQAGIVVGRGSASFEMIRHLAETAFGGPLVLPVPDQAWNRVQPVAIDDVLHWLVASLSLPPEVDRAFDIGGPEALTYLELLRGYAREAGLTEALALPVPVAAPRLGARAVAALTPVDRALAGPLLESMAYDLVCRESDLSALVGDPPGGRTGYAEAVRRALADEGPAGPAATDPAGSGPLEVRAQEIRHVAAPAAVLWEVLAGLPVPAVADPWQLLGGLLDGAGHRNGGGAPAVGHTVAGWRVDGVDPGARLVLTSESRLLGPARLEVEVRPSGAASRYRQTVTFRPRGLAGRVYWLAQKPALEHRFGRLATTTAGEAERRSVESTRPNGRTGHSETP